MSEMVGRPRTAQQCQRDTINVARLVYRLELKLQQDQSGEQAVAASSVVRDDVHIVGDGMQNDGALSAVLAYRGTMNNIREGKRMLQQNVGIDAVEANVRHKLNLRLDNLASAFEALHSSGARAAKDPSDLYHSPNLQYLRPQKPHKPNSTTEALQENESDDAVTHRAARDGPMASIDGTKQTAGFADSSTNANEHDFKARRGPHSSSVMLHHRAEQDAITDELLQMSSLLKQNSMTFSDMLQEDRKALEIAEQKLDTNHDGMVKQRVRLKDYTKKAGVSTWFVIVAVTGVAAAWFMMFAIMRVF